MRSASSSGGRSARLTHFTANRLPFTFIFHDFHKSRVTCHTRHTGETKRTERKGKGKGQQTRVGRLDEVWCGAVRLWGGSASKRKLDERTKDPPRNDGGGCRELTSCSIIYSSTSSMVLRITPTKKVCCRYRGTSAAWARFLDTCCAQYTDKTPA